MLPDFGGGAVWVRACGHASAAVLIKPANATMGKTNAAITMDIARFTATLLTDMALGAIGFGSVAGTAIDSIDCSIRATRPNRLWPLYNYHYDAGPRVRAVLSRARSRFLYSRTGKQLDFGRFWTAAVKRRK